MITDWVLVRRMAAEIERRFRGAKMRDAGLLTDGRFALALWSRGTESLLCLDVFGTPPIVTVESGALPIHAEPGFVRTAGATLRGMTLLEARSRRGDRLLKITFGARSRFGVGDTVDVYAELVPRFGNVIVVKGGTIVTAMKEFTLAENGTRSVLAGMPYELPPLQPRGAHVPDERGSDGALLEGPVYAYRNAAGRIDELSLVPVESRGTPEAVPSLLEALLAYRSERHGEGERAASLRRRDAIRKRLHEFERKLRRQWDSIEDKLLQSRDRESLKTQGEAIFATIHEAPDENERQERVERAQALFAKYKKLAAAVPHLEERRAHVRSGLDAVEELRWEADRTSDAELADVESALDALDSRRAQHAKSVQRKRRAPLEVPAPGGSRILIGRSPIENADLTFRVARPNDVWLHAQNVPGAHVIVQRDDKRAPGEDDISLAARYAAGYSKARNGGSVPVDYTLRKNVRKRKDSAPGLVWYTGFKTVFSVPMQIDDAADS